MALTDARGPRPPFAHPDKLTPPLARDGVYEVRAVTPDAVEALPEWIISRWVNEDACAGYFDPEALAIVDAYDWKLLPDHDPCPSLYAQTSRYSSEGITSYFDWLATNYAKRYA